MKRLREILQDYCDPDCVSDDAPLGDFLDSIKLLDFLLTCETEFSMPLTEPLLSSGNPVTLGALQLYLADSKA
ncbi:hypothetical protein JST97_29470 [bacterium]|nr:hypothetical protein [bacterium]